MMLVRLRCSLLLSFCLAMTLVYLRPSTALGQEPAVLSDGVDPTLATPVQTEQAQSRFLRGKDLFTAGDYEAALKEFEASRAIVNSPNARLYAARCLEKLGRDVDAFVAYGRTMVEALELAKQESRYAKTAEAARTGRARLAQTLAFIKLTIYGATPQTELFVDGEQLRRAAWGEPVVTRSGKSTLELKTPGAPPQVRSLELTPGATVEVTLSVDAPNAAPVASKTAPAATKVAPPAAPTKPAPDSLRPYAYAATALGVVGLGAFGFFGVKSEQTHEQLLDACPAGQCSGDESELIDRGKQQQLLANVGLGVGVLGLGAAVTLFLLEPDRDEETALLLSPFGVAVRGSL